MHATVYFSTSKIKAAMRYYKQAAGKFLLNFTLSRYTLPGLSYSAFELAAMAVREKIKRRKSPTIPPVTV